MLYVLICSRLPPTQPPSGSPLKGTLLLTLPWGTPHGISTTDFHPLMVLIPLLCSGTSQFREQAIETLPPLGDTFHPLIKPLRGIFSPRSLLYWRHLQQPPTPQGIIHPPCGAPSSFPGLLQLPSAPLRGSPNPRALIKGTLSNCKCELITRSVSIRTELT